MKIYCSPYLYCYKPNLLEKNFAEDLSLLDGVDGVEVIDDEEEDEDEKDKDNNFNLKLV